MPLVSLEVEDVFWAVLEDLNLEEASNAPPMCVHVLTPFHKCGCVSVLFTHTQSLTALPFRSTPTNPHTNQPIQ